MCLQLVYLYVTQPCLHTLMLTRFSANQSVRTILVILYYDFAKCVRFESHHMRSSPDTNWLKSGCEQKSLLASAAHCKQTLRGFWRVSLYLSTPINNFKNEEWKTSKAAYKQISTSAHGTAMVDNLIKSSHMFTKFGQFPVHMPKSWPSLFKQRELVGEVQVVSTERKSRG